MVMKCSDELQDVQAKETERVNTIKKGLQEFAKCVFPLVGPACVHSANVHSPGLFPAQSQPTLRP